jgi:hypothetical protein
MEAQLGRGCVADGRRRGEGAHRHMCRCAVEGVDAGGGDAGASARWQRRGSAVVARSRTRAREKT